MALDGNLPAPLHRQLYDGLRSAVLSGRLGPGVRLPASRALAHELGVSRNTVLNAFEQLLAEGYLEGRVGSGTFVARALPERFLDVGPQTVVPEPDPTGRAPSRRGAVIARTPVSARWSGEALRAFRTGTPAYSAFPFETWARLTARRWRRPTRELFGYGDPAGHRPLREAIAAYLGASRAVTCDPDQVLVVSGSQQGLDLAARVLLDPGDEVWLEDPGYLGARGALLAAGARVVPVPVDGKGLVVAEGIRRAPAARLAYVSPSHQYPLGATMGLGRRLELLGWARGSGAWVLEDDYDSEYRYAGRPLAALAGLDGHGRVVYLGTFSKVVSPALRLGYLVAPPDLVGAFVAAKALADRHAPLIEQAVLADFITQGHLGRHLRRTRALYAERQAVLVEAARTGLDGLLDLRPAEAGLHLVGWLPGGADDREATRRALEAGVEVTALSSFALERFLEPGLLLGYAAFNHDELRDGVRRLAAALRGR